MDLSPWISAFSHLSLLCAPQELLLKSLSCPSSTINVGFLLTAVWMYLKSHELFQQGLSAESLFSCSPALLSWSPVSSR